MEATHCERVQKQETDQKACWPKSTNFHEKSGTGNRNSPESVRLVAANELGLKAFKLQKDKSLRIRTRILEFKYHASFSIGPQVTK